jgi:outer membrane protein assembly factor BamB
VGHRTAGIALTMALVGGIAAQASIAATPAAAATVSGTPQPPDSSVAYQADTFHDGKVTGGTEKPPLLKVWARDLGGRVSYPVVVDGKVFVTASTRGSGYGTSLYALDATTGIDVWGPFDLGGTYYWSALAYGEGKLFALNYDGILQAFDVKTGALRWIVQLPSQWSFTSPPTYRNGMVYTAGAGSGGTVYAVSAADGTVRWTAPVANGDSSSPAVSDTGVYVSYACIQAYDLHPDTGAQIWHHDGPCAGGGGRTPVISNGRVWTRDDAGGTPLALDASTGVLAASYGAGPAPAFDGQTGFFLSGGVLKARNALNQALLWTFAGDGQLTTAPLIVNGNVYVGSSTGMFWALDEASGLPVWSDNVGAAIQSPDEHNATGLTGLGAGQGVVVVPASNLLVAYANAPAPPEPPHPFHPCVPARILDTRAGVGAPTGKVGPGATLAINVAGHGCVPNATGVSAVVLNVTVTEPTAESFLTAWPAGQDRPLASNLNFLAGQTVPNLVIVKVGAGRQVSLYNNRGSTHVVADVAGWYGDDGAGGGADFMPLPPSRILDTRIGLGAPTGKLAGEATMPLQVTGQGGIPANGVSAVVLNVTVTEPVSGSFLTAWPAGQAKPVASNLNFVAGQTVPNLVIVKVGTGGQVSLYNNAGATHVVADVAGWYGAEGTGGGADFSALPPARILDTRDGVGAPTGKLGAGTTLPFQVTGRGGVPASGVAAVVLNVTVAEPTAGSFLTAWPAGQDRPVASNLNFVAGQTVPNLVVVKVGAGGQVDLYSNAGAAHVVADVSGWFAS